MRTLVKQMKLDDPPLHWDLCLRDFPMAECDVAWVVNDPKDLKWAVRNRDRLRARQLWAGPNIVVVPQEQQGIVTAPQIDRLMVPATRGGLPKATILRNRGNPIVPYLIRKWKTLVLSSTLHWRKDPKLFVSSNCIQTQADLNLQLHARYMKLH